MNTETLSLPIAPLSPSRFADAASPGTAKAREVAPFLKNLRTILETESPEILRWTRDGRAFEILDMAQMSAVVLPKYFKHAKYTSFQRQLNYFNFRKWTKSKAVVCTFSNPHFVRDQPGLSWRINRKKSVPGHVKALQNSTGSGAAVSTAARRPKRAKTPQQSSELLVADMSIKLPLAGDSPSSHAMYSFASPTEVYSPALTFPTPYDTNDVCFHEPIELDWVDTLYSSLNGVPMKSEVDAPAPPLAPAATASAQPVLTAVPLYCEPLPSWGSYALRL